MRNYFFAGSRLQVSGEEVLLAGSPLSRFIRRLPCSDNVALDLSSDVCPSYEDYTINSTGSGIIIGSVRGAGWLISSEDKNNPCCILANSDYSVLQGYINIKRCSNERLLKDNFMQLLRLSMECHAAGCCGLSMHASCVGLGGNAVLFTAPSGTGKSTQSRIWKKCFGAKIVSGDRPFLQLLPNEVRACGVPWDGKEQIFLQEDYPVAAIVEVRRAKRNSLRKLSVNQAFSLMMRQCFIPMWDDCIKFSLIETIRAVSGRVPFYRLFCLPEEGSAELLKKALFDNEKIMLREEQPDMKLKEGFILKNVIDEWVVMPTGGNIKNFEGAIVLNDAAAFIWKQLENPISREDLLQGITDEYDIDSETAAADLEKFLDKLRSLEILQEF